MPFALTNEQLDALARAADYVPPADRNNFLRSVAAQLGDRLRPTDSELLDALTRALSQRGVAVGRAALAVGRPMLATNGGPTKLAMR